jgi:hypothetical protein
MVWCPPAEQVVAVASHPRCHILIGDVMCLSYMTGVVRLGGSARTAKDHLLAAERAPRSPSHFRAEELLELLGYHVRLVDDDEVVGVVDETLKVQSSLLSTLHMLSSKHGDFRFQFGARRDQPFRPDLR